MPPSAFHPFSAFRSPPLPKVDVSLRDYISTAPSFIDVPSLPETKTEERNSSEPSITSTPVMKYHSAADELNRIIDKLDHIHCGENRPKRKESLTYNIRGHTFDIGLSGLISWSRDCRVDTRALEANEGSIFGLVVELILISPINCYNMRIPLPFFGSSHLQRLNGT